MFKTSFVPVESTINFLHSFSNLMQVIFYNKKLLDRSHFFITVNIDSSSEYKAIIIIILSFPKKFINEYWFQNLSTNIIKLRNVPYWRGNIADN